MDGIVGASSGEMVFGHNGLHAVVLLKAGEIHGKYLEYTASPKLMLVAAGGS